ncbi:MAG: hypothetical protein U0074_00140 [Kouleothrix sp.]
MQSLRQARFTPFAAPCFVACQWSNRRFCVSTDVIAQGKRLVFCPDAIAYEPVAGTGGVEFGRKTRVITRGLREFSGTARAS